MSAHELRVLDGLHAGARAALDGEGGRTALDGESAPLRLAIGSALDNDIVLCDPGIRARHAWLQWDARALRWQLLPANDAAPSDGGADDDSPVAGHALGEAVSLGPVRVTVAAANDPFDPVAAAASVSATPLVDAPVPGLDEPAASAPATVPAAPRGARPVLWLALAATVLAALAVLALQAGAPAPAGVPTAGVPRAAGSPMSPTLLPLQPARAAQMEPAVRAVLKAQGLDGRLQLRQVAGRVVVSGLLPDPDVLEALAAALMRLSPRPGLQVQTPAELRAALRERGLVLPAALHLGVDGRGALELSGPVASEATGIDLQQRLRALLPPGVGLQVRLDTPATLAARFLAEARAQGFAVDGRHDGQRLVAMVDLPEAERARWERWLAGAHRRLAGFLPLSLTLRSATPAPRSDPQLPWRVASVVGGASPFVLLADGTRLLPGGRAGDVTLLQIDDDALLLQRAGQPFKVPR